MSKLKESVHLKFDHWLKLKSTKKKKTSSTYLPKNGDSLLNQFYKVHNQIK